MLRTIGFLMLVTAGLVLFVAPALASTPVSEAIGEMLIETIMPALMVLIGTLTALLIRKLTVKLGIEANVELERMAAQQAEAAVQYAGEMAAKKVKKMNITVTGSEKLNIAVAYLISHVPSLSREQAEALIHAALARIHGEGSTGDNMLFAS